MRMLSVAFGALLLASVARAAPPEPAVFTDLGGPLAARRVEARGVSGDGTTVVGQFWDGVRWEAFVWTRAEGLLAIGHLPGGDSACVANAVSHDGSVVVGSATTSSGLRAFRWTREGGMTPLPGLPDGGASEALDISGDASAIVGTIRNAGGLYMQGVAWRDDGITSYATQGIASLQAISTDGYTVAGYGFATDLGTYNGGYEAVVLGPDGSVQPLGDFNTNWHPESQVYGLSADGHTAVGTGHYIFGPEAFVWSRETGRQTFVEFDASYGGSTATDASADGSILVGQATWQYPSAYLHDRFRGTRALQSVLEQDYGLDLGGLFLSVVTGVSDDGRTLVGWGTLPGSIRRAWIAVLPPACNDGLDNDGDGFVDFPGDPGCGSANDAWEPQRDDAQIRIISRRKPNQHPVNSRRPIKVALLASDGFDIESVALDSLRFGPNAAPAILDGILKPRRRDQNGDGRLDWVVSFRQRDTGISPSDREACLQGDLDLVTFRACAALRATRGS